MITQVSSSLYQQLIDSFEGPSFGSEAYDTRRNEAFERFKSTGFPSAKAEEWRFTNIQPLLNESYHVGGHLPGQAVNVEASIIEGVDAYRIVLVNGVYRQDLSDVIESPGTLLTSLANATTEAVFTTHFAQHADKAENPFVWINTAMAADGFFLGVNANVLVEKPIHIVHISAANSQKFYQTRNLVVLEKGAEAEIIETFITEDNSSR